MDKLDPIIESSLSLCAPVHLFLDTCIPVNILRFSCLLEPYLNAFLNKDISFFITVGNWD